MHRTMHGRVLAASGAKRVTDNVRYELSTWLKNGSDVIAERSEAFNPGRTIEKGVVLYGSHIYI